MKRLHLVLVIIAVLTHLHPYALSTAVGQSPAIGIKEIGDQPYVSKREFQSSKRQAELSQSKTWKDFVVRNGNWTVSWNEFTGTPHRAAGKGIPIPGYNRVNAGNIVSAALTFIDRHRDVFKARRENLKLVRAELIAGKWYVTFEQHHEGVPVFGALVEIRMMADGRVFCAGSDYHPAISLSPVPALGSAAAISAATSSFEFDRATDRALDRGLTVLPIINSAGLLFRLSYEIELSLANPISAWRVFIDAQNGAVLERRSLIYGQNVTGRVSARVLPEFHNDPEQEVPLANALVAVGGQGSDHTDGSGNFDVQVSQTGSYTLHSWLRGQFAKVFVSPQQYSFYSSPVTTGVPHNWTWDTNLARQDEINVFYHINFAHDYLKARDTSFTAMDFAIDTFVKDDGAADEGGAYYSGTDRSLHFDDGDLILLRRNAALFADIVYHEYFHGVTDALYYPVNDPPRYIHEGMSDYFACSLTSSPIIADGGYFIGGGSLRNIEDDRRLPQDWDASNTSSAPYNNGLILAGAFWDLRKQLGRHETDRLVHLARRGYPYTYRDHLVEVLVADDDDGNISNGTPNSPQIIATFESHGISLSPLHLDVAASPSQIPADGISIATLICEVRDQSNNLITDDTTPITFGVTSGAASGVLVGPNPVVPTNGKAFIALRSTITAGVVSVEVSAAGRAPGTTTVVVSGMISGTEVSGTIGSSTTWELSKSPYIVTGDVRVAQGAVLTIEAGVQVRFNLDRDIYVEGALVANGDESNKIVFTANAVTPYPGYWGGIRFENSQIGNFSVMNHCQILYAAGDHFSEDAPIVLNGRINPQITNVTLLHNLRNGIRLMEGNYQANVRLDVTDIPYFVLHSDLTIAAGFTMTIAPGVIVKFASSHDLYVNGALVANGTLLRPIVFTAFADDAHGGDTNGDGTTSPIPGSWGGILFSSSTLGTTSMLNFCEIHYGAQDYFSEIAPITLDGRVNPSISNTKLVNNARNGIRLLAGTYSEPVRLDITSIPYFIYGNDLTIARGATMQMAPGVTIKFPSSEDIYVYGALQGRATPSQPIIFTSFKDDAHGGDTNGDGATLPTPGDWGGIVFLDSDIDSLSALENCELLYGGQDYFSEPAPLSVDPRIRPRFANILLANNKINGIDIRREGFDANTFLDDTGVPYTLRSDLTIPTSTTLFVEPGVIVKLAPSTDVRVFGALVANGTSDHPIMFTSMQDDLNGGDTNGDGPSAGTPGDWGGIHFFPSSIDSLNSIDFVHMQFGGEERFSEDAPLVFESSTARIQNTVLSNSRHHGVRCYGTASPDFGGGSRGSIGQNGFLGFIQQTDKLAFYNDGTADIYAKFNYWETTDLNLVRQNIFDFFDNSSKGKVIFEPIRDIPTAVELVSWAATVNNNEVELTWEIDSEQNHHGFEIERSQDGITFRNLGFVYGPISANTRQIYRFIDRNMPVGTFYYRLKQINLDGGFEFSGTVQVSIGLPQSFALGPNYPNPFNPETTIEFALPKPARVLLRIFNVKGQIVRTLVDGQEQAAYLAAKWDGRDEQHLPVPSGVYFCRMSAGAFSAVQKLMVIR